MEAKTIKKTYSYFRYCGATLPPSATTFSNAMTIIFKSDSSVSHEGFSAAYRMFDSREGKRNAGMIWNTCLRYPLWQFALDAILFLTTLYFSLWWKLSYINWGYSFSWMAWELCPRTRLFVDHSCTYQSTNWAEFH